MKYEFIDPDQILPTEALRFVERFLTQTRRWEIGWHYVTDLAWIVAKAMSWPRSARILDAGGGSGPTQFLLAEIGFDVTNIDLSLPPPSPAYRARYSLTRTQLNSYVPTEYVDHLRRISGLSSLKQFARNSRAADLLRGGIYTRRHDIWRKTQPAFASRPLGKLNWIVGNLCSCPEIPSDSYDAVVSLSALEHIPMEQLPITVGEIRRMLKPTARWAVTTSGTEQAHRWFHEPSKGWCFSTHDLESIFGTSKLSNGQAIATEVLTHYRECEYLQGHIAQFYKRSGNNGMPWGKWDPKYVPVGIYN